MVILIFNDSVWKVEKYLKTKTVILPKRVGSITYVKEKDKVTIQYSSIQKLYMRESRNK